jgi:hypothetical protein
MLLIMALMTGISTEAEDGNVRDYTCFQTAAPWDQAIDIGSDVAIVYGVNASFPDRVRQWRNRGYTVSMMTGISWGGYDDYYMTDEGLRKDEIQTRKNGTLFMHGKSTTVGYNVPSPSYVDYICKKVAIAVDEGVRAIYMEEPEYWAESGWSAGFKAEWKRFYGEDWQEPDSSVDAQYRASKLKYELYFRALETVFRHIKARAAEKGIAVECHVPTHSLVNYAQWRIVSPESYLMELEEMDGYIAQVWTGTARTPNLYRGKGKSRTFETAYLEYAQMLGMVRPTGRKVWFLHDPIEDNPNRSWNDYRRNYECTVIASLMLPEVCRYEVMPWPHRIFKGEYPRIDMDTASGEREGIPADYATEVLAVINALNDMRQEEVVRDTGTRGIGVAISDSIMFQRAAPLSSDAHLSSFFGIAMPLIKHGLPIEIVQLENVVQPDALKSCKVLFLTYEGQKPLKPAYHDALAEWVRQGGCLVYVGDGTDRYHHVREWWNGEGETDRRADEALFETLGIKRPAWNEAVTLGKGYIRIFAEKPRKLARYASGAEKIIALAREMLEKTGESLETQHYFTIRRGPWVVASVMNESVSEEPLRLEGNYIDVMDPKLPCLQERVLKPDERTLLYDLDWLKKQGTDAKVVAAAARVTHEKRSENGFSFTFRGPAATTARLRILLPAAPVSLDLEPEQPFTQQWGADSNTLWLECGNIAEPVQCRITF